MLAIYEGGHQIQDAKYWLLSVWVSVNINLSVDMVLCRCEYFKRFSFHPGTWTRKRHLVWLDLNWAKDIPCFTAALDKVNTVWSSLWSVGWCLFRLKKVIQTHAEFPCSSFHLSGTILIAGQREGDFADCVFRLTDLVSVIMKGHWYLS